MGLHIERNRPAEQRKTLGVQNGTSHEQYPGGVCGNRWNRLVRGRQLGAKFVDRVRPDYMELMRNRLSSQLGERYVEVDNLLCS